MMTDPKDLTPEKIWAEYETGKAYNSQIGLYDTVNQNENFYIGNQWEGLSAPDLDKPVLNFLKRVVGFQVSYIVTDSIAANFSPQNDNKVSEAICKALSDEVDKVIEQNHVISLNRDALRDCAVDGDTVMYAYSETDEALETKIKVELLRNTNVIFGNPYSRDLQKQPYILVVQHMYIDDVKKMAPQGEQDNILPDGEASWQNKDSTTEDDKRVTVLTRFAKHENRVYMSKSTNSVMLTRAIDTGFTLYPLAYMSWEKVKDSYHGQAVITGLIPNQIAVNKLWAMALRQQAMMAFPKLFYDRTKIRNWNNRVGEAIGVTGNPNDAIAANFKAADMSGQLIEMVDRTINFSRDFMGASDVDLGNVKPDNTSAILAVQKSSSAPLELQRLAFYQFVEDYIRVFVDIMRSDYGQRVIQIEQEATDPMTGMTQTQPYDVIFDFSGIDLDRMELKIDVGPAAYWSELMQMQTNDNLYQSGILDPATYVDGIPNHYIKNKNKILAELERRQTMTQAMGPQMGGDPSGAGAAEQYIGGVNNAMSAM